MPAPHRLTGFPLLLTAVVLSGCAVASPEGPSASSVTPAPTIASSSASTPASAAGPSVTTTADPTSSSAVPVGPVAWADTVEEIRTGVVRISNVDCEGLTATGSGFLVDDDLIVTNAHVVSGAAHLTVGSTALPAEVVGFSEAADLALLRVDGGLDGHVFSWVDEHPRIGDQVAIIGFPGGGGLTSTQGVVSSLEPAADFLQDTVRYIQTDASVNPGNSGGPLVTQEGDVAGVVFAKDFEAADGRPLEGTGFAVSVDDARRMVDEWATSPELEPLLECPVDPAAPDPVDSSEVIVEVASTHEQAGAIAQTLALHGNSINTAQYDVAFGLFTPAMQERMQGVDVWEQGVYSSYWRGLAIEDVSDKDDALIARVWLVTEQLADFHPEGQTCSVWPIEYTMVLDEGSGVWQIDQASLWGEQEACA